LFPRDISGCDAKFDHVSLARSHYRTKINYSQLFPHNFLASDVIISVGRSRSLKYLRRNSSVSKTGGELYLPNLRSSRARTQRNAWRRSYDCADSFW